MASSFEYYVLMRHLSGAKGFYKPPKGIKEAYKTASRIDMYDHETNQRDATSQLFLEVGFQAWVAYFLSTYSIRSKSDYKSKGDDIRAVSNLENCSNQTKRAIAARVNRQQLEGPNIERVSFWEVVCGHRQQGRSATGSVNGYSNNESVLDGSSSEFIPSMQEPLVAISDESQLPSEQGDQDHMVSSNSALEHRKAATPQDLTVLPDTTLQQVLRASISGVVEIFPPYICSAIVKDHNMNAAMIQMSFPGFLADDCHMTLTIQPNKIEYLAMKLFGIHLESEGEQRYLLLENGARVVPASQVSLEGVDESAVASILGDKIISAVKSSWKRASEVKNAIAKTRCVTMGVNSKSNAPATLGLWLGLERGIELRDLLYPVS